MSSAGSVTTWVEQLRAGNLDAARPLLERYFPRLVGLARKKLGGVRRAAADEEDVAQSAFHSFCQGVARGRFSHLEDRANLWALLVVIVSRKAIDLREKQKRRKRGGGNVGGESVLDGVFSDEGGAAGILQVPGTGRTPEQELQEAEAVQRLLALLPNDQTRRVAVSKVEGLTNAEIAAELGCADATVERRLKLIRTVWKKSALG
jgi:RNA polymerase sigma factor (sigma-70 family)